MTRFEYAKLMYKAGCQVNIRKRNTDKEGIASFENIHFEDIHNENKVYVFYGSYDGVDDGIITSEEFNNDFIIVSVNFVDLPFKYDDWIFKDKNFSIYTNN